jgi:hypothetical protein
VVCSLLVHDRQPPRTAEIRSKQFPMLSSSRADCPLKVAVGFFRFRPDLEHTNTALSCTVHHVNVSATRRYPSFDTGEMRAEREASE